MSHSTEKSQVVQNAELIKLLEEQTRLVKQMNRELEIEQAMEHVRVRTMAMQRSEELQDVAILLFQQVKKLGINPWASGINIWQEGNESYIDWVSTPAGFLEPYTVDLTSHPVFRAISDARKRGEDFFVSDTSGEALAETYALLIGFAPKQFEGIQASGISFPTRQLNHYVLGAKVGLMFITPEPCPEAHDIFKRLGKVFEQTYTRFLDLQKAEAQVRESQIEAALERVRSQSMAMHKSNELLEVIRVLSDQLLQLGFKIESANFNTSYHEKDWNLWLCNPGRPMYPDKIRVPYLDHPYFNRTLDSLSKGNDFNSFVFTKEEKDTFLDHLFTHTIAKDTEEEIKKMLYDKPGFAWSVVYLKNTCVTIANYDAEPYTEEQNTILRRFGNVFEQSYTRFLDLQKAESQSREAQIELGLERVRARAMAMQHSEELKELIETVFTELTRLDIVLTRCLLMIYDPGNKGSWWWMANSEAQHEPIGLFVQYHEHPPYLAYLKAWEAKTIHWQYNLQGQVKKDWDDFLFSQTELSQLPDFVIAGMKAPDSVTLSASFNNFGNLTLATLEPLPDEQFDIMLRFAKVFDLTYTRFNDLQKAEEQAREAQIETALEKIRSRSLAMHKSEELQEVVNTVYERIKELSLDIDSISIIVTSENEQYIDYWIANEDSSYPSKLTVPVNISYQNDNGISIDFVNNRITHTNFSKTYSFDEKNAYFINLFANSGFSKISEKRKQFLLAINAYALSIAYTKNAALVFAKYEVKIYSKQENIILQRFANVFEQSYIRFLDLQKAEVQSREAQIELGLERVRAKAMAMQNSEELNELIGTVFYELTKLDFLLTRCVIMIYDPVSYDVRWWMANSEVPSKPMNYLVKHHNMVMPEKYVEAWQARELKWQYHLKGKTKKEWDDFIFTNTELYLLPDFVISGMKAPESVWLSASFNNFGSLTLASLEPLPDEQFDIMLRFAKVFDLTYTRFNDLQKAEAQAKEALIEAGLERVRYSAMAMQSSEDVGAATAVVFNEISLLGIEAMRCGIAIMHLDKTADVWAATAASGGREMKGMGSINFNDHPLWIGTFDAWINNAECYTFNLKGDDLISYYKVLASSPKYDSSYIQNQQFPDHFFYAGLFEQGALFTFSLQQHDAEKRKVLKRFTAVFSLTFRRYLDLKQAEAQTREAQIEAALERVRSRTLAMQKSDELAETAAEVFRQLISLGIEPNRLYIGIIKSDEGEMEMWATDEDGTQIGKKFLFHKNENVSVKKLFDGWATQQKSVIVNMEGKELDDYFHYLNHVLHIPFKEGLSQKRRVQSVAYFSQGFIGMASPDGQGDETIHLLERFAAVFNLTFTRFNDLKMAEAHAEQAEMDLIQLKEEKKRTEDALNELQITQKQLIQAEKMASLGELTAGIAHEIQNPLNFVNNFSEVSTELVDEMNEEIQKGNIIDAQQIATDLKDNLIKINHHGKRAGDIVRSMLQHSRSSSGQKEATDINALADEYLRLSYHGLRAKDKSFNASFVTEFDPSLPVIEVVPQDIGRVILNLINNAFYAVSARLKQGAVENYQPKVTIQTKRLDHSILISITDNGTGMSEQVADKIFQPFFTTKPTGQGTGLGLSLSYDIVKAHGGELNVETTEGEGTTFVILLPV